MFSMVPSAPRKVRPADAVHAHRFPTFVARNIMSPFDSLPIAEPNFYYVHGEISCIDQDITALDDLPPDVHSNFFFDTRQAAEDGRVPTLYDRGVLSAMIQSDGQIFNPFTRQMWDMQSMPHFLRRVTPDMARAS